MIRPIPLRLRHHRRPGFLLLEVLVGITVFGMFLSAVGLTLLRGQEDSVAGGDRVRGVHAVLRAFEASRAIRDGSFSSLTAGAHGIALGASKKWVFSGSAVTVSGGYLTSVTVTQLAADWVRLTATSRWKHGYSRTGSLVLTTELTDWRNTRTTGDWSTLSVQGSYTDAGTPLFNDVVVYGNYAFVTSDTSSGGAGLYIFDVSNLASPTQVAGSFTLGASAYDLALRGTILYVVTSDASQEIRAYDISSPTTFSSSNLLASYNLSGSSLAVSLAVHGSTLYVGTSSDATYAEFYAFDVSNPSAIVYRDSLDVAATVNGIALAGTGAYLATTDGTAELKEVNVANTADLKLDATNPNYNITSTEAGRSIATSGTSALLGRQKGSIQEMVLLNLQNGGGNPPPSPGPWYHEGSGSLVDVDFDAGRCYAFLAAESSPKAIQVVSANTVSLPEASVYNSTTGQARGLFYDVNKDRLFAVTRRALLIFQPSGSASPCSA